MMFLDRRSILLLLCILLSASCTLHLRAAERLPPNLDASISRGLGFLLAQQARDGSFGATQKPAITSLALMSYLSTGQTPGVGKYGNSVRGAIDYLLAQAQPDGSFGRQEKMMYGQAMVTLALAEAYGVEDREAQRKRIAAALAASVKLILAAQDVRKPEAYAGGWRYEMNSPDSDLSLSGWNVLALRACQDAGIAVPRNAAQRASKFVLKCYNVEAKGFAYQPGQPVQASTTGIGILCLHLLDNGSGPEAQAAAKTLAAKPIDDAAQYPYYALYYATQAAFQAGDPVWPAVSKATFGKILRAQQGDGGWPDSQESAGAGRAYQTSIALLTLAIPYRLLPVYQR